MGQLFRRLHYLLNRRSFDEELQNDMNFHREMAARDHRDARRNFGNTLLLREQSREAWGWTWIDRLLQDLRYATRTLSRSPGFTLTALLVLGVGIGVNLAAFTFVDLMLFKSLPVRDPGTLVRLQRQSPENSASEMPYRSVAFYREHAKTLSAVMATLGMPPMALDEDPQPVNAAFVTANYFSELGTVPAYGRLFEPSREDAPDAPPSIVLSSELWQRRFGSDPSIVGKIIHVDKKPVTVIGVAPYALATLGGDKPEAWLPLPQHPYFVDGSQIFTSSSGPGVRMWARLAPGVTAAIAEQELLSLTNELRKQYPAEIWDHEFIHSEPGGHLAVARHEEYRIIAAVGCLVLLILAVACANLGGLLMARGVTREHEISIRLAIGASRRRIFRQLFTESLLLALLGSATGLALGYIALRSILVTTNAPAWMSAAPDWRVLLFALALTLLTAIFFGLAPALQIARQRQRKTIVRQILVAAQVAVSCILLIVSSLLVRAAHHALYTDPGFGYEQVVSINPNLASHGFTPTIARAYLDQLEARLRTLPSVTSVALVKLPPLGHITARIGTDLGSNPVDVYPNSIDSDYLRTMSIPLLRGRSFLPGETGAIIVSESFARRAWPGEDPLGKLYQTGPPQNPQKDTVVGIAGNAHVNALNDGDSAELYWAAQPSDMADMSVLVKTASQPEGFPTTLRSIATTIDPRIFPEIRPLKLAYRESIMRVERIAVIVSLLGAVAILIASIGLVGLVAYAVSQRTREIAIRLALGAGKPHILASLLRQFVTPVGLGALAGAISAACLSQVLRKFLYGISGLDPLSYTAAITLLAIISATAALWPARRALRVDPVHALRQE